jgi:hypothetical protein
MRNLFVLAVLGSALVAVFGCETEGSGVVISDQYAMAGDYDDSLVSLAQQMTAHIESQDIEIRATYFIPEDFGATNAMLNAEENWVQPTYTFIPEEIPAYDGSPDASAVSINGVIMTKMKSKESIDGAFGIENESAQGICADVQQQIYDTVYSSILTKAQRAKYKSAGKSLSIIPDDDVPPLSDDTNPALTGGIWETADPASGITSEGRSYFFEPKSAWVDASNPDVPPEMQEGILGIRYCTLLSHQAILSWMISKSFEDDPVLITPGTDNGVCDGPASWVSNAGSCFFFFGVANSTYYCADFTGAAYTPASAEAKCGQSIYDSDVTTYSVKPCDERTAEIEAVIPDGGVGLGGACIVKCKTADELVWNIYQDDVENRCTAPYTLILLD